MIVHGEGQRYVVSEIVGQTVGDEGGKATADYAVLDSHYCYREIAHYTLRADHARAGRSVRRNRAVRHCDRLNRGDAELEARPVRPSDFDYFAELAALQQRRLDLVLWLHEQDGLSGDQIGKRLGISGVRARQLIREAQK